MANRNQQEASHVPKLKIALVHDWLYGGGAEKVVEELHKIYPDAPIYTSYCSDEWRERLHNKVITGYLQRWPFSALRKYLPLLRQWWFAGLDLSEYDLVISSSGNGEAKFARKESGAKHICYCHTPPHFLWRKYDSYYQRPGFGAFNWLARLGLKILVKPLRNRDYAAAQQVDIFIANSSHIQKDIKQFYGRDSQVIFPPVNVEGFNKVARKISDESPFIYWGRHVPDKRIDLAVQACSELGLPLTIAGEGVETARLKAMAGPSVSFVGRVSEDKLLNLAASARGFIFPSEEDFGISPVEAMAAAVPVIAYKAGGALDYVVEGKTGLFFDQQNTESLKEVLSTFNPRVFDDGTLKSAAEKFSNYQFRNQISKFIDAERTK